MGANSTQAVGLSVFLLAAVALAVSLAQGGNLLFVVLAFVLLAASAGVLLKIKSREHELD